MFDLTFTTILSLLAPAIIAPLLCLGCLRMIRRAESARQPARTAPAPHVVLDAAAALDAERERHAADRERQVGDLDRQVGTHERQVA